MKYIFALVICCFLFIGCSTYTEVTYRTIDVTENPVGTKVGQVDREAGGALEAARNGGITRISTVSIQDTVRYRTSYWTMIFGGAPVTTATLIRAETIVTGD